MLVRRIILALTGALLLALPARGQVAPDAAWFTFDTEHFRVHYQDGLARLARAAAARAETARALLSDALVDAPSGRVHLVIADNVDYANGLATIFPRNTVVLYAHAPVDEPSLAFAGDWLELLVGHELAHVHHLDHASGIPGALRSVFGRSPALFPGALVPRWTTEGLATYLESRLTGAGRVHGTFHEMVLRTAVLEDRFFSIDRATGGPTSWPAGNTAYVYGSLFSDWLAGRYGEERAGAFVRELGGNVIPYLLDDAARSAYGVSFSTAWRAWRAELRTRYAAMADSLRAVGVTEPEPLAASGRVTQFPRYAPDGRLAFAASTGREEASTRILHPDGRVEVVAPRTTVGPAAWLPGGALVTAQLDLVDPYRVFSDLYRVGAEGDVDRLTRAARLMEPDARRTDGRLVAVRGGGAANALVTASAEGRDVRVLVPDAPGVNWGLPRWSPAGDRIAVGRWEPGGNYDVVVLDTLGRMVARAAEDRAIDMAPAWTPDGRWIVFSSDRTGIPNLVAWEVDTGRLMQVTNVLTGAFQPDVSPDARWIAFAWYRADGYHLARIPFDPSAWRPAPPVRAEAAGPLAARTYAPDAGGRARRYSPLPTLPPTGWSPTWESGTDLGVGIGAAVDGQDVIGRHRWAASATFFPDGGRTEGLAAWQYAGLGVPVLGASALQDWDVGAAAGVLRRPDGTPVETALLNRQRSASLVATFPFPRFRSYTWVSVGANYRAIDRAWDDPAAAEGITLAERPPEVGAVLTVGRSTARAYDFSISQEEGWLAAATVEGRRFTRALAGDREARGYVRVAARAQGFVPVEAGGFARHVVAGRMAAAADAGSRSPGFSLGGVYGSSLAAPLGTGTGIGAELDLPLRGYEEGVQSGDRAVTASLEYRLPLALVERGIGIWPFFVDRLWAGAFADGGAAWCLDDCPFVVAPVREARPLVSVGAELGADLRFFFYGDLALVAGVGVPLREVGPPEARARPSPSGYVRIGRAF